MRAIWASEFKANCLAILDEVERTGEAVSFSGEAGPSPAWPLQS